MERVNIESKYNVSIWSDSDGTQKKYYKDGIWYKTDTLGREGIAEHLVSVLLSCSNVSEYVFYEQCEINGRSGCKSASFTKKGEHFVSFHRLYSNYNGGNLAEDIFLIPDVKERIDFVCSFVEEVTGLDCRRYLCDNLALDMLIRNPDRHFGNLGVVLSSDGEFRLAPIFDNGQALYQNFQITPPILTSEEKEARLTSATVSGNFETQALAAGIYLKINYEELYRQLDKYPDNIAKSCLLEQLCRYRKIFSSEKTAELMERETDYER